MEDVKIDDEPKGLFDEPLEEDDDVATTVSSNLAPATVDVTPSSIRRQTPPAVAPKGPGDTVDISASSPVGGQAASLSPVAGQEEEFQVESKLHVVISGYDKRGEGMQSYVVYKIVTKPVVAQCVGFTKKEYDVWRRFSDFLGLHDKLVEKHLPNGVVIPAAPEKDVFGTTKTKISKTVEDDAGANEFLERRRATLERFLRRCSLHPTILLDPDFRDFLTFESDLPKSSQTATLSGTSVMRLLGKVGDTLSKMTVRIEDGHSFFQDKQFELEELDDHLKKLHGAVESLIVQRKELSASIESFCKALCLLAACEDNTSLSKALSVLSEIYEKIGASEQDQADNDSYLFSENLKDYVGLVASIRDVFNERVKAWQTWQTAQLNLARKRENKTRLELAGRSDKVASAKKEVQEHETRVQDCEDNFEKLSRVIRRELSRFDTQRIHDFKLTLVQYLESLAKTQQTLVKLWEAFLPDAKGVIC